MQRDAPHGTLDRDARLRERVTQGADLDTRTLVAAGTQTQFLHQNVGLASKLLALIGRQLPHQWQQRYGYRPVLLETFVETPHHRGTCYKAANWPHVAQTTGRGNLDVTHQHSLALKDIRLYRLSRHFHDVLRDKPKHPTGSPNI